MLEATGVHLTQASCEPHLRSGGARSVIITAPPKDASVPLYVCGVNAVGASLHTGSTRIISSASCTTAALAPLLKLLHDNFTILDGFVTIIHAVTASQRVVDAAPRHPTSSLRSGRAASNLVPAHTGAALSISRVLPELDGKILCSAWRVPVADVSALDVCVRTADVAGMPHVPSLLRAAAASGAMHRILRVSEEELVSGDYKGEACAVVVDAHACASLNAHQIKLTAWFDNEAGYGA